MKRKLEIFPCEMKGLGIAQHYGSKRMGVSEL